MGTLEVLFLVGVPILGYVVGDRYTKATGKLAPLPTAVVLGLVFGAVYLGLKQFL